MPSPDANYRFDDGSGSAAVNSSGNGYTATLSGGAKFGAGQVGGGVVFDGVNIAVSIGNPAGLDITGEITLAAWVKPAAAGGTQNIIGRSFNNSPKAETVLRINGTKYEVGSWNGTSYIASGGNVTADLGKWVYFVGTYNGAAWTLYENGV